VTTGSRSTAGAAVRPSTSWSSPSVPVTLQHPGDAGGKLPQPAVHHRRRRASGEGTPTISGKKAKASGQAAALPLAPVRVFERDEAALAQTLIEHYEQGETVMMLFRKSSDKLLIEQHLMPT
jgi:hypothetical protein